MIGRLCGPKRRIEGQSTGIGGPSGDVSSRMCVFKLCGNIGGPRYVMIVLVPVLVVVMVFCSSAWRYWWSLGCNEALSGNVSSQ